MQPDAFVEHFGTLKASAILRAADEAKARAAMDAAVRGGLTIVEFTLTTPGAYRLISEFAARDGLVVGAGTVLTVEQAEQAVKAGARFLVSPVVDEAVIEAAAGLGVAAMPGVNTPTEAFRAHRAGAQLVKLFPMPEGGPAWVRSVRGPLPMLRVVPTNGVDAGNFAEWLDAGIHAAGFVRSLFGDDVVSGNVDAIETRARAIVAAAQGWSA
jgi:2-dehydro-3-deoxyphosphogluconate aldolase/(4S)-4-hydroxy-2-oxoglutarate aldolase